jgi:hypothetical protein
MRKPGRRSTVAWRGAAVSGVALAATAAVAAAVLNSPAAGAAKANAVRTTAYGTHEALSGIGYADHQSWSTWRGQPVTITETWNDAKDAAGNLAWGPMNNLYTVHDYYSDGKWNGAMSIAQPMYASNETVQGCATTAEITTWANALKTAWKGDAFIRLAWEFNGDWYSWKQRPGDAEAFKACWVKWYNAVKAVSTDFKLVWNPNHESSDQGLDPRRFFPGRQYVDAAGPDYYAMSDGGQLRDPDRRGGDGRPVGINAWLEWVQAQGVPFAVPEWGVHNVSWGSTDPAFMTQLRTAFERAAASPTGLAYEDYFDGGTAYDCTFSIHDSGCPGANQAAADRYRQLWSRPYLTGGTTPPTTPTTPPTTPTTPPGPPGTLPHTGWTVNADSQETAAENGAASRAIDGNPATFWHTRYTGGAGALPHSITIDLHATRTLTGLSYLPRPAGAAGTGTENGRIGRYRVEVGTDGTTWRQVATGTWPDSAGVKSATFTGTGARFVRLTALSEAGNRGPWTSIAEVNLTGT